jgi:hypothetical protein
MAEITELEGTGPSGMRVPTVRMVGRWTPWDSRWIVLGIRTETISSSRSSRARCSASRESVFTRSPASRCSFDSAATSQRTPAADSVRANPNPVGPAS